MVTSSDPNHHPEAATADLVATVLRLFVRPEPAAPPVEVESLDLVTGEGIVGDHARGGMRHVTLLCVDDWDAAAAELDRAPGEIDPKLRRANVLLSGGGAARMLELRGQETWLGDSRITIRGQTAPCPVMERAGIGMRKALQPENRAGVWARIAQGGTVRRGEVLRIMKSASVPE